ncbi:hypothetical protein LTR08_000977 [Meristemomyces frigidus]|nr:hypothetical protein LTR08_000977 [Meristemomyces frigidus]
MSRILPLSGDAVSQIHSSKHITSLQGVVFALLENSLDAGATKVDISVDFRRGGCTIEDNGCGILPSEFHEDGGLGRMYHTSKHCGGESADFHGKTGTYVASLAALSLCGITSRHARHNESATLTTHHGKVISRQTPALPGHDTLVSDSQGTRVTVRDLFGNMPVRVKQRALNGSLGNEDEKAWRELKRGIVALLLTWSKPCAVKIQVADACKKSITLSGSHSSVSTALTERSLNQLGGSAPKFDLQDALPLVFQAGLAPAESRQSWVPVSTSTSSITIKGAICLEPAPTRHCQFMSVSIYPCSADAGHNELYDAINRIFAHSSFGALEDIAEIDQAEKDRRKQDRRFKTDQYTQKQLHGRKGVDRWPMFVLQIKLRDQRSLYRLFDGARDTSLKAIVDVLEATVTQWLAANHFRPQKRRQRKNENQQGPAAASSPHRRAESTTSSTVETPGRATLVTPSLKRQATIASATTSKKRRILDLAGRPVSRDDALVQHSPSSYFDTLSRIKSGRRTFYDEVCDARKPATAPAGRLGSEQLPARKPIRAAFKLPVLEAGEVGSAKPGAASRAGSGLDSLSALGRVVNAETLPEQPSDDFGSVDDTAMLNAVEDVESGSLTTNSGDSAHPREQGCLPNDTLIDWMDPVTKNVFQVNARTGVVLPHRNAQNKQPSATDDNPASRSRAAINTSLTSAGKPLSLSRRFATPSNGADGGWLPGFLKVWSNPVFHKQDEDRIPVASFDGPGMEVAETSNRRCTEHGMAQHFAETGVSGTSKLSKAAMRHVKVIRQVDNKFILCKMPATRPDEHHDTLVLVDQHAASERVMLEGLFAELSAPIDAETPVAAFTPNTGCTSSVNTTLLERPPRFQLSSAESEMFVKHAPHFARWGILYDVSTKIPVTTTASQPRQPGEEHRLTARSLPPGIAERCTLSPNLLIELLRAEVWALADSGARARRVQHHPNAGTEDDEGEHGWLKRMASCPKGVVDLLNSRACRSAIMFNDVLSVAQCEELLADLSRCAFPFMCAHGRVSMVPLIEMGREGEAGVEGFGLAGGLLHERAGQKRDFGDAFKRWRKVDADGVQ